MGLLLMARVQIDDLFSCSFVFLSYLNRFLMPKLIQIGMVHSYFEELGLVQVLEQIFKRLKIICADELPA